MSTQTEAVGVAGNSYSVSIATAHGPVNTYVFSRVIFDDCDGCYNPLRKES